MGPEPEPMTPVEPVQVVTPPVGPAAPSRTRAVGTIILRVLERTMVWTGAQLSRPKVRSVVVGILLIIIGAEFIDHSVWTFPIVIIGILMIVVAWVGSRLEGRFGIEWSDQGAGFEMRARFKSAGAQAHIAAPLPASSHVAPTTTVTGTTTPTRPVSTSAVPSHAHDTVIEGEAHTIEIDVAELKALIAAAELATAATATSHGTPVSWQETDAGIDRGVNGPGG